MKRQQIIDESLHLFANHGYENTSLAMIADNVGIKKPSLYNHFKNKEAIFMAVLDDVAKREVEVLKHEVTTYEGNDIEHQLTTLYKKYLAHMSSSTEGLFFKRVTFFPPDNFEGEIKRVFLLVEEYLTSVLEPIIERGKREDVLRDLPTDTMTSAFYTLIDGLFLEENFYPEELFEKRKEASWSIFWLGIQA
ncbi:TetR/AcrR family transcriptional regulator [Halobacillus litoralis]|uniref:TetR/AcrR family transcriptional regulator n=1 Tax=Halobacillus litoralis TaxID=45668 RepID=UPI001CD6B03A|nr:TetR/AcrR family transcriptional regulator [Halobacillus litoralis]MCA0971875.1 TetR/AcrR family transcriptional regulator [Halobacillus litoralis]